MRPFLAVFLLAGTLFATAAGDSYRLAPAQLKQLQADQKTVERAYSRFVVAQQDLQSAQAKMQGDAERIKQTNGWPADAVFRGDTLTFYPPAPKPPGAPAGPLGPGR